MSPRSCDTFPLCHWVQACVIALLLRSSDCSVRKQRWSADARLRLLYSAAMSRGFQGYEEDKAGLASGFRDLTSSRISALSAWFWTEGLSQHDVFSSQGSARKLPPSESIIADPMSATPQGTGNPTTRTKNDAPPTKRDADILLSCAREWFYFPYSYTWVPGNNCSTWFGVTCDPSTRAVISLKLSSSGLEGPLPSQIQGLRSLRILDLSNNDLQGVIPGTLGRLSKLTSLDLSSTRLVGEIPSTLGSLSNLISLSLGCIRLFSLYGNPCLSGTLPASLAKLRKLTSLKISSTLVTGPIPAWVWNLKDLRVLDLSASRLEGGIPTTIGGLSDLMSFSLGCDIQFRFQTFPCINGTIPSWLSKLQELTNLMISYTNVRGPIPSWIGNLVNLKVLDLSSNSLEGGIPAQIRRLPDLMSLSLGCRDTFGPCITGTIPSWLVKLQKLTQLSIEATSISGQISSWLGQLRNLRRLYLNANRLKGTLPASIGKLGNLTLLYISQNEMTGELPHSLGNLSSLVTMALSSNRFNGTLPSSFGSLQRLEQMYISDSLITGSIPSQWSSLASLKVLDLSRNSLTGPLPPSLGNLRQIMSMYLSDNRITGSIPSQWSGLSSLQFLQLNNNQLSGTIHKDLRNIGSSFASLDLSRNQLTGVVPAFTNVRVISIRSNYFTRVLNRSCSEDLDQNCLFAKKCPNQRTRSACEAFCNATRPRGVCDGRGNCAAAGANGLPTCTCDQGFVTDPLNLGNCVPQNTPFPPPPPPSQGQNQTLGLRFQVLAPRRFLNRYSRYISFGFSISNTVPRWNLESAVPWMAPASLFTSAGAGPPSEKGILIWDFVRDQECSSCWAEVAADSVASSLVIARNSSGGPVPQLSVPQILNCTNNSGGCQGDLPTNALDFIVQGGLVSAGAYNVAGSCPARQQALGGFPQVLFYESVQFRGWIGLLLTVQNQPAIITLEGSSPVFQQPTCALQGFVLSDPSCYSGSLDHSVLVVGYDLNGFRPYWVIRNSWGTEWCTQGYMRLGLQGGDGTCGMNVLPAYYPVPAPRAGDPCFRKATIPDTTSENNRRPVMNPCGGGTCKPATKIDPYSYTCTCPKGFVAVNNSVDLAFPTSKTQSCIPVDACGLSLSNPCKVGTCVNDGLGGYSCICPLGYISGLFVDGNPTCTFVSSTISPTASYTVGGSGVTCALIGATYNLTQSELLQENPGLNCDLLPPGTTVNVSNPSYQCAIGYIATVDDRTCQDVLFNTVGDKGISLQDLAELNSALNCSNIQKGQLVCLKKGSWPAEFVCTLFQSVTAFDTCATLAARFFTRDPALFFGLNPGIDCQALTSSLKSAENPQGESVCVGAEPVGTGNRCPLGFVYSLRGTENCDTLYRTGRGGFKSPWDPEKYNQGKLNVKCNDVRQGTRLCTRTRVR